MNKSELVLLNLNKLLVLNYKTERVFLDVLGQTENPILKNFLRVAGYERNQFIKSLDLRIRQKGNIPTYPEDSLKIDVKLSSGLIKKISDNNNQAALIKIAEIQTRDIEKYKEILKSIEFSDSIKRTLRKQLDKIVKSLYSIDVHKDFLAISPKTMLSV